ncbi:MAG: hypothetical protein IKE10_01960 [Bacilli bacterium]|nr:hypothetical protein [Bacilli bacterium]
MSDILMNFNPEDIEKWNNWKWKSRLIKIEGLKSGRLLFYDNDLLTKLRNIYSEGIPASITLLCNYLTNGKCFESAFLLSRVFLNDNDTKDVNLVQAQVDSIKLNPVYKLKFGNDNCDYSRHTVVERILNDGRVLIYDTTAGFAIDYDLWEELENPTVVNVKGKKWIEDVVKKEEMECPEFFKPYPIAAAITIPEIEKYYDDPDEEFAGETGWLQHEVELFKKLINYEEFCKQHEEEIKIKRLQMKEKIEEKEDEENV